MRTRTRAALGVFVAAALPLSLSACGDDDGPGGDARKGGSITIAETSSPDSLDPAQGSTVEAASATWLVYPGLVTYRHAEGREGTELIPAAAESLPEISADGKTYRLRLRQGLRYSDGSPVRASDFEHAVQRSLALESAAISFFEAIEGVTEALERGEGADISGIETNDRTGEITINLTERNGLFSYTLALPAAGLVPRKTPFKTQGKNPPPGLGAYKFARVSPNREFVLERNRRFDLPGIPEGNVDRITVKIVKSQARQTQDVISGKLDWMLDEPPADLLLDVRSKYRDRYEENVANSTFFMFLNTRREPFDKLEVRQAVNYALDKRALVRIFGGLLQADCNFLPPGMSGYDRLDPCPWGDPDEPPDLEKARNLVEQAGETGTEVIVWGNDDDRARRVTEFYADTLNKIGLEAKPRILGGDRYFQAIDNRKTNAETGFDNAFQAIPHPADFFTLVESATIQPTSNLNHSVVSDPEVDKLAARIKASPADEVAELAAELDQLITGPEKAYIAAYGHSEDTTFVSKRMDFENCTVYHPVYLDDWSQFCLK